MHECSGCHGEKTVHCDKCGGQENGLWGFSSASASNAPERASVLALSAAGQASLKPRPNQTDRLPDAPIRQFRRKAYVIQMEFVR